MPEYELDICDYIKRRKTDDILIDVRDKIAFGHGSISGAINIPLDNIQSLYQLPPSRKIYVFCQKGEFSKQVAELLRDAGYDAYNLTGGYAKYLKALFDKT